MAGDCWENWQADSDGTVHSRYPSMKTKIKKNYPYYAAGRTWPVPELRLVSLPDGTSAISEEEIYRIHRAIANEICGNNASLSMEELEFLCDVTLKEDFWQSRS